MIVCRELKTMNEMEQVQKLEYRVWKMQPIPTHQTLTATKNGGIMLGMFDGEQLIGFSYGFAGYGNGKGYLCSHMLGIDAAYRSRGLGETLKQKQCELAIEKGYDLIKWTFDPLETRNGHLNLSKLNGVCHTYVENCYGEMVDELNKGLPSDRFEVHWHISSPYVKEQHMPNLDKPTSLNTIYNNKVGSPVFKGNLPKELNQAVYTMEVPNDFQTLKAKDSALALDWRLQTRANFQKLFQSEYTAVRLEQQEESSKYYFVKKETLQLGGNKR